MMILPPSDLKAIFFDLDNVLVYSEVVHFQAWQIVMEQLGIDPKLLDFQSLIGIADSTQAVILKDRFDIDLDATSIWKMKRAVFFKLIPQGFSAPLGRNTFLESIKYYTTGVVSSSGIEVIKEVLRVENILPYFDFIIGHEDCSRHKPEPLPYLLALEKAQVLPEQALVIEDSPSGIQAALLANIPVIGIFKDQTPENLIESVTYFETFEEVNAWLSNNETEQELIKKIG